MKKPIHENVPILVGAAVYLALLAFLAGLVAAPKAVALPDAPLGPLEFWIFRYQTLIAAGFAIVAAALSIRQFHDERARHRETLRLTLRHEVSALRLIISVLKGWETEFETGSFTNPENALFTESMSFINAHAPVGVRDMFLAVKELNRRHFNGDAEDRARLAPMVIPKLAPTIAVARKRIAELEVLWTGQ